MELFDLYKARREKQNGYRHQRNIKVPDVFSNADLGFTDGERAVLDGFGQRADGRICSGTARVAGGAQFGL